MLGAHLSRSSMKGEKATMPTTLASRFSIVGALRITFRLFQFIMGITVIAIYAHDLDNAHKQHKYTDSKWVWAVVCGSLGSAISVVFMMPLYFFYVDAFIFLCFLVAFSIFGKMYIHEDPEGDKGITRMKHGVWVLLTNMLLWFLTAAFGLFVFIKDRKARTVHTGRASQHV